MTEASLVANEQKTALISNALLDTFFLKQQLSGHWWIGNVNSSMLLSWQGAFFSTCDMQMSGFMLE